MASDNTDSSKNVDRAKGDFFEDHLSGLLHGVREFRSYGRIAKITGTLLVIEGLAQNLRIGDRCEVESDEETLLCEVVKLDGISAFALPYGTIEGIGVGCKVYMSDIGRKIHPHPSWLGRVMDAFAQPIDDRGPLASGFEAFPTRRAATPAHTRRLLGGRLDLGIRAMNIFTPLCMGQRLGIFAGSGVGKSILLAMIARYCKADVVVIGLIGERGREVREFLERELGEEGLKKCVVVVATSDQPALKRREAAYLTLTVCEYFQSQGLEVLCLMDSLTRFAMAQREIGLSSGEPPATKGYPPSTFSELPKLLERAGPGTKDEGNITAIFTVLVEGDDHNEPISDAVRGILDGHIVLSRAIAQRGRYPAIDVLQSISRSLPDCHDAHQNRILDLARLSMATYADMAELIRLGAYRKGSSADVDNAIAINEDLEAFLRQPKDEHTTLEEAFVRLTQITNALAPQEQQ